jgi:repressor LexA
MNERAKRIYEAIERSGYSYPELSKITGISKSSLQRYATGETVKIPIDSIEAIAKATNTSAKYLMCWESSASSLTPTDLRANTKPVPLVGRVAAGLSCHAEDNIEGYILTDCELLHEGYEYFWLTVKGDSMEPELHDGDRVLVREQETLDRECFAVVRIDGEDGVVKRVRIDRDKITLTSVNPYYPPRVFEREQMNDVAVVGKVISSQRIY